MDIPHRVGERGIAFRRHNQVRVVGHEAKGPDRQPAAGGILAKKFQVEMPVFGIQKDVTAPVASLRNVMGHSGNGNTRSPHDLRVLVMQGRFQGRGSACQAGQTRGYIGVG